MSLPNIDYPPFYSHVLIIHIRKQSIKNVHRYIGGTGKYINQKSSSTILSFIYKECCQIDSTQTKVLSFLYQSRNEFIQLIFSSQLYSNLFVSSLNFQQFLTNLISLRLQNILPTSYMESIRKLVVVVVLFQCIFM